jgi:PAS domain S-box-containing protein
MNPPVKTEWSATWAASFAWRYGLASFSIAAALGLAYTFLYFGWPQPFTAFALCAIALTFWYGGTKPGILAALLSWFIRSYLFESQTNTASRILYNLVFLVFAVLMTRVTRERNDLEVRVSARTSELTHANEDLQLQIFERKQAEYLTRQVFECSPDSILVVDRDYRYRRVNPAYGRNRGISADRMVGMHVAEVLGSQVFEQKVKPNLDRSFAGEDVSYADWFTNPTGRRYLSLTYSPLRPDSVHVEAALVIARDLTEYILAEDALRQTQADLARVSRVTTMGELTASLAHEVNQPIAAAVTDANTCVRWLMRESPDLREAREAASRVVKDVTRAAEIVSRVRLLFKKGASQRESVDMNEVIREMIVLLEREATRYSISVRTEQEPGLPQVLGDRVQLQQVLMNLMVNAIDAMKDVNGRRELVIKSAQSDAEHLMISVSDNGVGLPAQQADQIFNAFFTTKLHGTGMGLRISRSIVESHGGQLSASDNPPHGARFYFTLPIETPSHD